MPGDLRAVARQGLLTLRHNNTIDDVMQRRDQRELDLDEVRFSSHIGSDSRSADFNQ
jgi:hypothetical protein